MTTEDTLITRRDGRVGRILMNRPRALNALDLGMIQGSLKILREWADDPQSTFKETKYYLNRKAN